MELPGRTCHLVLRIMTIRLSFGPTLHLGCCFFGFTQIANKVVVGATLSLQLNHSQFWTFRTLTDDQLAKAEEIFEEFLDKEFLPAYLADADPNRALLDKRVICDLLRFDNATYEGVRRLAAKWCAEPSVHGGKQRPKGATLVM